MQEIRTARARFDTIEGRFREIDKEIADILAKSEWQRAPCAPGRKPRKSVAGLHPAKRSFQLSY